MSEQIDSILGQCQRHLESPSLYSVVAQSVVDGLVERYREPWRKHHAVAHLGDVLGFLIENVDDLESPRATLWAAIGHDSIYIPQATLPDTMPGMNEILSAELTESKLAPYLPDSEVHSVGKYIRATIDHEWDGEDADLAYLLDADLKILGAPPDEFAEYDANIWREYQDFVDHDDYDERRQGILRDFYDQERLFITDAAHDLFEAQAKLNLEERLSQF